MIDEYYMSILICHLSDSFIALWQIQCINKEKKNCPKQIEWNILQVCQESQNTFFCFDPSRYPLTHKTTPSCALWAMEFSNTFGTVKETWSHSISRRLTLRITCVMHGCQTRELLWELTAGDSFCSSLESRNMNSALQTKKRTGTNFPIVFSQYIFFYLIFFLIQIGDNVVLFTLSNM